MEETKKLIWDQNFPAITFKGNGVRNFLHGQTTSDIKNASEGEIIRTCWLSTLGRLRALLEIQFVDGVAIIIILSGELDSFVKAMDSVIFPADNVQISDIKIIRRVQILSLEISWKKSYCEWLILNQPLKGAFEEFRKATIKEVQVWKIKQGFPDYLEEINNQLNPYEIGLGDLINLNKGCYLGQEAIARLVKGQSIKQKLMYWEGYENGKDLSLDRNLVEDSSSHSFAKICGKIITLVKLNESGTCGLALIRNHALDRKVLFSSKELIRVQIHSPIDFVAF